VDYQLKGKCCLVTAGTNGVGAAIANLLTAKGACVIVADRDEAVLKEYGPAWHGTFVADLSAAQGSASAVNIGSGLGKQPEPEVIDYGLFKAGILHLTKSLAKSCAPHVRVNAVSPGPVWTGLFTKPGGIADQIAAQVGLDREGAVEFFFKETMPPDPRRTPLPAVTRPTGGDSEMVSRAVERAGGGREFVFTGSDFHKNMGIEPQRRILLNGIQRAAKIDVPEGGMSCSGSEELLKQAVLRR
jgi:NAD(P)-dependent dehydrogenase (short-subunit alcohol dehydrogenase family)